MPYDLDVVNEIMELMTKKKMTLAVAESVTSGHLQAALSAATTASSFFQGGITAYNLGQKTRHLNIEPISALEADCVDEFVAQQMAIEVNKLFLSNYGIATTGYASKVPEKDVNEIYLFYAFTEGNQVVASGRVDSTAAEGVDSQIFYAREILRLFLQHIRA